MATKYEKVMIGCVKCKQSFNANECKVIEISKQETDERIVFATFLYQALKRFVNHQLVKCPSCGEIFKARSLKVLRVFDPEEFIALIIIFAGISLLFFVIWLTKGTVRIF